jgi:hypothetical protein
MLCNHCCESVCEKNQREADADRPKLLDQITAKENQTIEDKKRIAAKENKNYCYSR